MFAQGSLDTITSLYDLKVTINLFTMIYVRISNTAIIKQHSFIDPLTASCAAYGIAVKCSDEIKMADNPVYGVTYCSECSGITKESLM